MDTAANNLANASTDGFKADGIAFGDAMVRQLRADGGSGRALGSLGSGPREIAEVTDRSLGTIRPTGNPLDVAIMTPDAMFAVRTPQGIRYTRAGAFTMSQAGDLVTNSGAPVLNSEGRGIRLDPGRPVEISPDGRIRQGETEVGRLGLHGGTFRKEGNGLWTAADARPVSAPVQSRALEGSNVNPLTQMVDLIKINRLFEMSQRAVQSGDETTGKLLVILNR